MTKILVIDDDQVNRETLEMFLLEKGFEVYTSGRSDEGIKVVHEKKPDIVILDIWLRGMDSLEALRKIKEAEPDISVIMITSYYHREATISAMKLGAYDYIYKPIDVDELEITVEKVASNRWVRNRLRNLTEDNQTHHKQKEGLEMTELKADLTVLKGKEQVTQQASEDVMEEFALKRVPDH